MASLFGPSPQEIMFARQQQMQEQQALRQQQIAQQGQQFGIFAPLYQAGLQLGDVGTQAAMQSLFPTPVDPALQRATAVQGVISKYQGENLQDPEVLSKIASDLMTVSPEAGLKAADLATKFTKDKPKPLTPSDTFAQVGLSLGIQPKTDLTQYTPEEAKRINDEIQLRQEGVSRAGAPTAQDKSLLKGTAETRQKILDSALNAQTTKNTADRISQIVDSAFTGVGSGAKLTVGQLASAFGADVRGTTETEQLDSLLAQLAQGQARSLPGALSDKDLAFLREAIGKRTLTVNTLKSLANRIKEDAIVAEFENEGVQNVINSNGDLNRFDFVKNKRQAQQRAKAALAQEEQEQKRLRELRAKRGL